jgi:hypothetical protein
MAPLQEAGLSVRSFAQFADAWFWLTSDRDRPLTQGPVAPREPPDAGGSRSGLRARRRRQGGAVHLDPGGRARANRDLGGAGVSGATGQAVAGGSR